ncbi:hypothetical protein QBC42DRAFT_301300 [Cladorrhinum samala]|uniref:Heterokaryon incompatibility domain-containing protein n=1 Tax=Cladorrhinum samala TaxID=585594 RepID=A0AAV9HCH9_9PEZI|nr:hypothetical protein QBC42DRAFT_301300 [Cladorrhinum samala]
MTDDMEPQQTLQQLPHSDMQLKHVQITDWLIAKGVVDPTAKSLSCNEFRYWRKEEVCSLFDHVDPEVGNVVRVPDLESFQIQLSPEEAAAGLGPTDFVKPSLEQGYATLSHVWAQGLGSKPGSHGLHRSLIEQVFDKVEPLNVGWLWIDSLAIPGSGHSLTETEEGLKSRLINAMADIYRLARLVIIFDALLLRTRSQDPLVISPLLCCGQWIARLWTYQEIKLATKATFATQSGFVSLSAIEEKLKQTACVDSSHESKYYRIRSKLKTLSRDHKAQKLGAPLNHVAFACFRREATIELDYARAIFPLLGLYWSVKFSLEDAMGTIYEARKDEACRLVFTFGIPRARYPGWAPARFPDIEAYRLNCSGRWKSRGLEGEWRTSKVSSVLWENGCARNGDFKFSMILCGSKEMVGPDAPPGSVSKAAVNRAIVEGCPRSWELFEQAVKKGTAYILRPDPPVATHSDLPVLAVERFTKSPANEAWVCFVAFECYGFEGADETLEWLLLHENPTTDGGKERSELNYLLEAKSPEDPNIDPQLSAKN